MSPEYGFETLISMNRPPSIERIDLHQKSFTCVMGTTLHTLGRGFKVFLEKPLYECRRGICSPNEAIGPLGYYHRQLFLARTLLIVHEWTPLDSPESERLEYLGQVDQWTL